MSDNPSGWGRLDKQSLFAAILFVGSLVALGTWETWQGRVHAQDASGATAGPAWAPPVWSNALISQSRDMVYQNSEGKVVVTIHGDGAVEYGQGFNAKSAAKEFWSYLAKEGIAGQCLPMTKAVYQNATVTANPTPAQRRRSAMQAQVHAQDASAVTSSAGTPLGTFTVTFDVPPKQDLETTGFENCKPGESRDIIVCDDKKSPGAPYCEDKSRFLLMSQDGKWHCLRLVPPNGAQR